MSFKDTLINLQQKRVNGPFKKIQYINPNPHTLIKKQPCLQSSLLMLSGIAFIFIIPIIIIVGEMSSRKIEANQFYEYTNSIIVYTSGIIHQERTAVVILLVAACIALCLTFIFLSQFVRQLVIYNRWHHNAEIVTAAIVDHEIQERLISHSKNKISSRSVWEYRVKTQFSFEGQTYEATPGIVNRFNPGSACVLYKTKEECERALNRLTQSIQLQVNKSNPLDCEITENFNRLYKNGYTIFLYLAVFLTAIAGFALLFIHLFQHGHT